MNANRLAILVTGGIAVSGCGLTAEVLAGSRTTSGVIAAGTAIAHTAASTTAAASPGEVDPRPAALWPPRVAQPQVIVTAQERVVSGATFAVTLVDATGRVLATAAVPADARWTVGAGDRAAYWVTGGDLQRLDTQGVVTTLAAVPSTESGRVVISPDGAQWAYATESQAPGGAVINRLYRGGIAESDQLIVERISDPSHPTADALSPWQYYLESWTSLGILIERQPVGGCGCGTPFDMEMTAGFTAFIDPVDGTATPITQSDACPLSGVAADGSGACFHVSASGASDSIQFVDNMQTTAQYRLSGTTNGGDVTFHGSTVAYATVPSNASGCGGPDWRPATTLHVMDAGTGVAHVVGPVGLAPVAWLKNGAILATLSAAGANGSTSSSVVSVDPGTGQVIVLLNQTTDIVGVA